MSGCYTASYPFGHGKAMALKVLKSADHSGLYTVFGEEGATLEQLMETDAVMDVINCQCKAVGKSCSSHAYISAILNDFVYTYPYCFCVGEATCFYPFAKHDENEVRYDNEDEGDSKEDIKEGSRENGD